MTSGLYSALEPYHIALGKHMRIGLLRSPQLVAEINRDILRIVAGVLLAVAARQRGVAAVGFAAAMMATGAVPGPRAPIQSRLLRPTRLLETRRDEFDSRFRRTVRSLADDIERSTGELSASVISAWFEYAYGRDVQPQGLSMSEKRRDQGLYFTPQAVADVLIRLALHERKASVKTVVDPAMGGGSFLLSYLRFAGPPPGHRRYELEASRIVRSLHGVDRDPLAVDLARCLVWLEGAGKVRVEEICDRLRVGDSLYGPPPRRRSAQTTSDNVFRWDLEFPSVFRAGSGAGFDLVVSNPPWGALRPTAREYVVHSDPGISGLQGTDARTFLQTELSASVARDVTQRASRVRRYAHDIRDSGWYSAQSADIDGRVSGGDSDYYKLFMERAHQIARKDGTLALIVPSAFYRAEGSTGLRQLYFRDGTVNRLIDVRNSGVFPIHPMFRFSLIVFSRGKPGRGIEAASFDGPAVDIARAAAPRADAVHMSRAFLSQVSGPSLAVPEVRSRDERALFTRLHDRHPRLGQRRENLSVEFVRELDMTVDADAFVERGRLPKGTTIDAGGVARRGSEKWLPLYEGRMIQQYDAAAKAYVSGQARTATWRPLDDDEKVVRPHYFVRLDDVVVRTAPLPDRAAYCEITGHANERTVLSAIVSSSAVCGNKVPTCRIEGGFDAHLIWTAIANSFVVDWLVRRRIGSTLNYFHWRLVPFPDIAPQSEVGRVLVELARAIALTRSGDGRQLSARDRALLRAEVDARVANLYGLTLSEFAFLLGDFPLLDRRQPPLRTADRHELRSTITRDLALSAYARLCGMESIRLRDLPLAIQPDAVTDELTIRVEQALAGGAVAYRPTELTGAPRPRARSMSEALAPEHGHSIGTKSLDGTREEVQVKPRTAITA